MESANDLRSGKTNILLIFREELIMEDIVRKNPKLWMVAIYLFAVAGFLHIKPHVSFTKEGHIKPFGTTKKGSTIFPVWWWMFIFAVMAYIAVAYITNYNF